MEKMYWVNPLSHYVFEWWLKLFSKYFDLEVYDHNYMDVNIGKKFDLKDFLVKGTNIFWNFFNFYKNPIKWEKWVKIIWDIFTNSLSYNHFFDKNTIFYTEYFETLGQRKIKTILGRSILNLFRWKKFIAFTKQTTNFVWKYWKVLYFPQIYVWKINESPLKSNKNNIKILFVWNMQDWKKNIEFIFQVFEKLPSNFSLHLVWAENKDIFKKYKNLFNNWKVKYYWFVEHDKLNEIYSQCDIFFFPSKIDPIGAVVLEAMANGLAIITNKNVGASSYIDWNGFVLDWFNKEEYVAKFLEFNDNLSILDKFKNKSIELVKQNHWFKNQDLMEKRHLEFKKFIND